MILPKTKNGKPKLSVSQRNKWVDNPDDYVKDYFMGIKKPNPFLEIYGNHGHAYGEYLEAKGKGEEHTPSPMLNQDDLDILDTIDVVRGDSVVLMEYEISYDRGEYVIDGYIDILEIKGDVAQPDDFKACNVAKKSKYFKSDDYVQLPVYVSYLRSEGYKVSSSNIIAIGRKGNVRKGEELRLTGEVVTIPLDISEERVDKIMEGMDKTAQEISDYYEIYLKYFENN